MSKEKQEMITIPVSVFKNYIEESCVLSALESGGVDNWDYYGYSISEAIKDFNADNGTNLEGYRDWIEAEIEVLIEQYRKQYGDRAENF